MASHLKYIYKYNMAQWEPFNLFLCNFAGFRRYLNEENGKNNHHHHHHDIRLNKNVLDARTKEGASVEPFPKMWNETDKCLLDLFPKVALSQV